MYKDYNARRADSMKSKLQVVGLATAVAEADCWPLCVLKVFRAKWHFQCVLLIRCLVTEAFLSLDC